MMSDRVLLQRIGTSQADATSGRVDPVADLLGAAALVWVAIDSPRSIAAIADETTLDLEVIRSSIALLVADQWAHAVPA